MTLNITIFEQLWLVILLLIWAALLFGGFSFGKLSPDGSHRIPRWARMASSFTLVIAGWSLYLWFNHLAVSSDGSTTGDPVVRLHLLLAVGMTFGFIGDLFMARLIIRNDNHVLGGIGSFGLGHIAYIAGMVQYIQTTAVDTRLLPLMLWLLVGVIGWTGVVFYRQARTVMHYAALPYTLLLATTAGVAAMLAFALPQFVGIAIGAALFLLSDLVLAAELFRKLHFRSIGDVVWLTYGPGQMLIVYSFFLLSPLSPLR